MKQGAEMIVKYSVIQNDGLNFVRLYSYFLNYTRYVNDLHNIGNRRPYVFKYHRQSAHLAHSRAAASVQGKMATMQHKTFAFVSSLKLSRRLLCSVSFVFVSTFNLKRGRTFVVGITNLSKQSVCVKAKAPADHVYHRRTSDEFKTVLSVAHASQPVE